VLLSPSTVKRPDFEAVMGSDDFGRAKDKIFSPWFLAVSSKLCQKVYDDTCGHDLRSTDPCKGFYRKKNGEMNNNCSCLLENWTKLLKMPTMTFSADVFAFIYVSLM